MIEWTETLPPEWDELAGGDPFMTARWLTVWREAFAPEERFQVCTVRRDGRLVAGLPLLGDRRTPPTNDETSSFHPLAVDDDALARLMEEVLRAAGRLTLAMVPAGDPLLRGPRRALSTPYCVSPLAELCDGFDAWREHTRPNWRAPIERLARKMEREHDVALRMIDAPHDVERGFALEAAGWKGREGTAILSRPQTAVFYRGVAELAEARVSTIELDGELVAFALCLLFDDRLWQLKIGFDEGRRKLAPGLVMHLKAIERACEMRLTAYELLGDESEWKRKFCTDERAFVRWTGYARAGDPQYVARRVRRALRSKS